VQPSLPSDRRPDRNGRASAVILVFAALVVILVLTAELSGSQSAGLRAFGIVVVRTDGSTVRAQAIRESQSDASSLAADLAAISRQRSARAPGVPTP
jgi:hypothetical protein